MIESARLLRVSDHSITCCERCQARDVFAFDNQKREGILQDAHNWLSCGDRLHIPTRNININEVFAPGLRPDIIAGKAGNRVHLNLPAAYKIVQTCFICMRLGFDVTPPMDTAAIG